MATHDVYDTQGKLLSSVEFAGTDTAAASATAAALAVIGAVRDPKQPDPSVTDRLAALECLLVPPE